MCSRLDQTLFQITSSMCKKNTHHGRLARVSRLPFEGKVLVTSIAATMQTICCSDPTIRDPDYAKVRAQRAQHRRWSFKGTLAGCGRRNCSSTFRSCAIINDTGYASTAQQGYIEVLGSFATTSTASGGGPHWLIKIILLPVSIAVKKTAPMGEQPLQKRGPLAWDNHMSSPVTPLHQGGTTRLLIHSVGDATAQQWLPKVRSFLAHCTKMRWPLETNDDIDQSLSQYFDTMCYEWRLNVTAGSMVFFGLLCIMPELRGRLHMAIRSLKSWHRLSTTVEGGPMAEEALFCVAVWLLEAGQTILGVWVLGQYDAYAREQDMEQLQPQDFNFDGQMGSLDFGVSSRGETVKTGANQGVIFRRAVVTDLFIGLKMAATTHNWSRLLPLDQATMRKWWHKACLTIGIGFTGPPHTIRHSGPSEDLSRQRSTLEIVRRRGRWKSLDSVQRYTKTFALTKYRCRMPPPLLAQGKIIGDHLRDAVSQALQRGKRKATGHDAIASGFLLQALRQARAKDVAADVEISSLKSDQKRRAARTRNSTHDADAWESATGLSTDSEGWCTE